MTRQMTSDSRIERYEPLMMALFLLAVASYMLLATFDFGRSARILPRVIGTPLFILALTQVTIEVRRLVIGKERLAAEAQRRAERQVIGGEIEHESYSRSQTEALLVVLAATGTFLAFGVWTGGAVFIVLLARWSKESWLTGCLLAAGVVGVLYLVFAQLIGVRVFPGLVTTWLVELR